MIADINYDCGITVQNVKEVVQAVFERFSDGLAGKSYSRGTITRCVRTESFIDLELSKLRRSPTLYLTMVKGDVNLSRLGWEISQRWRGLLKKGPVPHCVPPVTKLRFNCAFPRYQRHKNHYFEHGVCECFPKFINIKYDVTVKSAVGCSAVDGESPSPLPARGETRPAVCHACT